MTQATIENLKNSLGMRAFGEPAGNLTIGRGAIGDRPVHIAIVENRIASGSLGTLECGKLTQLFRIVAKERGAMVLYLDSAGARVSQGLPALGAFRTLFHAGLEAAQRGGHIVAVLGSNCYGGASMLAHLARVRLFSKGTQLAMSGPSILAQSAGSNPLDEMFRAIAQATIGSEARAKTSPQNQLIATDLKAQLAAALNSPAEDALTRHAELGKRLGALRDAQRTPEEALRRKDLDKLFPENYAVKEADGIVAGTAHYDGATTSVFGILGGKPIGAARAWLLADLVWRDRSEQPVVLLLDSDSHAARLEDEKIVLSEYLFDLAVAFASRRPRTVVLGKAGGGAYVAFAGPARHVALLHKAEIQLLPGAAIASILGEDKSATVEFADYAKAGVADEELKLGLVDL
jgi:hypothetical protein